MKVLGAIVKNISIAFFFFSIITTLFYFTCLKKLNIYIQFFNNFTSISMNNLKKPIEIDNETKEILHYPNYGDKFGTIIMPSINISVPLYHGDSLEILKKGAGHYSGSYFPSENGTILIAAHNRKEFFRFLPKLKENDNIILDTNYGKFTYKVYEGKVMKVSELETIKFNQDREILVLYTCYPVDTLGFTNERYVVYADLLEVTYEN